MRFNINYGGTYYPNSYHTNSIASQTCWNYSSSGYSSSTAWDIAYYPPQKPEFVIQMEEAIAEGERQEQKAKEKLWKDWLDSKMKESLY